MESFSVKVRGHPLGGTEGCSQSHWCTMIPQTKLFGDSPSLNSIVAKLFIWFGDFHS